MKCIHCGNDTKFSVRNSNAHRCGSCRHPFAFEPKTDPLKLTDGLFAKIISFVSGDGKLFYTEKQLWYEFNRRAAKKRIGSCGASAILIIMLPEALHLIGAKHALLAMALLVFALAAAAPPRKPPETSYAPVSLSKFRLDYLRKWIHAHGDPDHMLLEQSAAPGQESSSVPEDLSTFSFDRALVTQHADIAAMLVANNFHFENNCAILSLDGYPGGRFPTIMQMLGNNPALTVFALHDASYSGSEMGAALRAANWFPNPTVRIVDLGLRPVHAIKTGMILLKVDQAPPQSSVRSSLTADEMAWLRAGNVAEVANVRPGRLMRSIYQGFARATQAVYDGSTYYDDSGVVIWMYDPGMDIYAADSFG